MSTLAAPITVVAPKQYYTDGIHLFYVKRVNRDGTIKVENCKTLMERTISIDVAFEGWRNVRILSS